ncbi:MAG TPA: hypothetical protein VK028_02200 [Micromonosporaceae bacterium]|nr:hypothetical protein [Micromonosporaceae bacterium]
MGEMMLGMVIVGLIAGIMVGRTTQRSQRSFADTKSAKVTYEKARKVAWVETRRAVLTVAVVGALFIAFFVGMINMP